MERFRALVFVMICKKIDRDLSLISPFRRPIMKVKRKRKGCFALKKKQRIILAAAALTIGAAAAILVFSPEKQSIQVMDRIFLSTGEDVTQAVEADYAESKLDTPDLGEIASAVPAFRMPAENYQSNFGQVGSKMAFHRDGVAIQMEEKWVYFEPQAPALPKAPNTDEILEPLAQSIACTDGKLSFTIPDGMEVASLLIYGRVEPDGMGGMSVHYLEEEEWKPGNSYSFDVSGGSYTDLAMDLQLPEKSGTFTIDLLPYLPDELKTPAK